MAAVSVKCQNAVIILFCIFVRINAQEINFDQISLHLNNGAAFIDIERKPTQRTLDEDKGHILRKMFINLTSIGLKVEPEETWLAINKISNDSEMAALASGNFNAKILPNKSTDGTYIKPTRDITPTESKKLIHALKMLQEHGFKIDTNFV